MPQSKETKAYIKRRARKVVRLLTYYDKADVQTSAQDMLTDIMHLFTIKNWDFEETLEKARMHHAAETLGGEHG